MKINRNIIWLFHLTTIFFWASLYVYVPYLPPYLNEIGIAASVIGYVTSAYGMAMLITRIPIGIFADRIQKQKVFVLAGIVLAGISAVGMQMTENVSIILIFRFVSGIAAAAWVCFVALYSGYFPPEKTTQAIASLNMYAALGRVIASFIGASAAERMDYQGIFLLGAVIAVWSLICGFFAKDPVAKSGEPISVKQLLQVGKNRYLVYASLLAASIRLITYATTYTFTNNMEQALGAGQFELGILQALTSAAGVTASFLLSTRLAGRISEKGLMVFSFLLVAGCQIVFPFCTFMPAVYVLQFLSGLGENFISVLTMALSVRYVLAHMRGSAMGYYQAVYSLGMSAGPIVMGYLVEYMGYSHSYFIIGLVSVGSAFLAYTTFPDKTDKVETS